MAAKRRGFGAIKVKKSKRTGAIRYEASYPTPVEYCEQFPAQPDRQSRNFTDPLSAEQWLAEEHKLIQLNVWTPVKIRRHELELDETRSVLFKDYAQQWVDSPMNDGKQRAAGTKARDRGLLKNHLNPVFGSLPVRDITRPMVDKWLTDSRESTQPTARYHAYSLLKTIMHHAETYPIDNVGHTLIDRTPCVTSVPKPKKKSSTVHISEQQVWELHDACLSLSPSRQDCAIIVLIGLYQGMRIGEILALRHCDVDLERNLLHVSASLGDVNEDNDGPRVMVRMSTKTDSSVRDVPIHHALRGALVEYMRSQGEGFDERPLFPSPRGGGFLAQNSFNQVYKRARMLVSGLEDARFHMLRHKHITEMTNSVGLAAAARDAGHSTTRTTFTYNDAVDTDAIRGFYTGQPSAGNDSTRDDKKQPSTSLIVDMLTDMDPSDIADMLTNMTPVDAATLLEHLSASADLFDNMDAQTVVNILQNANSTVRSQIMGVLSSSKRKTIIPLLMQVGRQ